MEAFSLPTEKGCCLVDLFGYDGTPMLACLEEWPGQWASEFTTKTSLNKWCLPIIHQHFLDILEAFAWQELCEGKNCCVGTVCLDASGSSLSTRVANKVFDAARSKKVKLNAFPDISSLVASLKRGHAVESTTTYRVTARQNDRLVIVKNLAEKWLNEESTSDEAKRIIEQHNKEHNANGEYMLTTDDGTGALLFCSVMFSSFSQRPRRTPASLSSCRTASAPAVEPPPKRVKLEEASDQTISKLVNPQLAIPKKDGWAWDICGILDSEPFLCDIAWIQGPDFKSTIHWTWSQGTWMQGVRIQPQHHCSYQAGLAISFLRRESCLLPEVHALWKLKFSSYLSCLHKTRFLV